MILTKIEHQSAVFQKLALHYRAKLDMLRATNDGELSPERTAKVRGRIAEVREFLAIEHELPDETQDETQY